jgi:hypothetical protein
VAFATSKDVVTRKTFVLRIGRDAVVEIGPLLAIGRLAGLDIHGALN